jgi:amino acid transporter
VGRRVRGPGQVTDALARNRLGVPAVVFFVVAAAAPLTVVAGAVTTAYSVTGFGGIPFAYVLVTVVLAVFAAGFVAMSRRIVNAGAFYSYVARGLGRPAGIAAAMVAVTAYALMEVGLVGGFGAVAALILHVAAGVEVPWLACALVGWVLIGLLGILRVDLNGRVLAILLVAEIAVAVLYDAVLLGHPAGGHVDIGPLWPTHLIEPGGIAALVGAIASFVGFESTVVFAEETKDPRRTVPRATYIAIGLTGVLYAASAWALPVATGTGGIRAAARADGTELMFDLVLPYLGQTLVDIGHLLFLTSLFAAGLAFHNIVARYLFALGRERVLPARFGRASRSGAPRLGSLTQSLVTVLALAVAAALHVDPAVQLLFWLTVVGGFGVLLLMAATSVAVVVFFHRIASTGGPTETLWRRRIAPATSAIVLSGVAVGTVAQFDILLGVPAGAPVRWIFPVTFAVVALIGFAWALILRRIRPEIYLAVGLGANSVTAGWTDPDRRRVSRPREPQAHRVHH